MLIEPLPEPQRTLAKALDKGHLRCHFSQFGEDAVLWTYLQHRVGGFYVDIGCHHPFRYSNTALLFIARHWRGVNIDVDERAIALFMEHRPRDVNICAAVGRVAGQAEVTLFDDGAVNSLDPASAADPRWTHLRPEQKTVEVTTLRDVLEAHVPHGQEIGLMNIDVEGWDMDVLVSNDWSRFRPDYVAVEDKDLNFRATEASDIHVFMAAEGYRLVGRAFLTSIYERGK